MGCSTREGQEGVLCSGTRDKHAGTQRNFRLPPGFEAFASLGIYTEPMQRNILEDRRSNTTLYTAVALVNGFGIVNN
jgi:hypothetical protein